MRRHGSWREVIHATSCPDGVVTPAAAMASMKIAVNCRSVTPGTNACVAAASASSATRTDARMASTSSGLLTRRIWRSIGSPSMNSAAGNALGNRFADEPDMESVATRFAVAAPGIFDNTVTKFKALKVMPYRFSCGISSGMPSSHVLSRCTAPFSRTNTQPGPNAREPAVHSRGAPET